MVNHLRRVIKGVITCSSIASVDGSVEGLRPSPPPPAITDCLRVVWRVLPAAEFLMTSLACVIARAD